MTCGPINMYNGLTCNCIKFYGKFHRSLKLIVIEMPFNTFANRADPDQAALVRAA